MSLMCKTSCGNAPSGAFLFRSSGRPLVLSAGLLVLLAAFPLVPGPAGAQDDTIFATQSQIRQVEQRLDRIERVLDSSAMNELLQASETLSRDLRELRGEVETLRHEVDRLSTRQRDQFRHLDERVAAVEGGAVVPEAAAPEAVVQLDLPEADEQAAYQDAFDDLMSGDYASAVRKLEGFLEAYPDGSFAANAWYWLAEAKYASGDFEAALEDFQRLREDFPDSDKSGDALLKIGYSYYELQDFDAARQALEAVRADYGGTTLDRLARERLRRIDEAQ
ncbi:tol-pal system protein YbgF [Thioalkalivibrio sp. ALJ16]|uniref:tol-pal system protein YbgF n=1 Tax=Thioalkalivibrio sp. ALJ16 TaxID=1158762 RepID=UPI0009D966C4|nr:tol-pal system protein YbgF [Thioalkalivibrio sp. ALJ16]